MMLMLGWALGRAGRTAFFIKEAGPDKIPYMYIIGAVLAVIISPLYSSVVDRLDRQRLMILLLSCAAALLLLLRVLIPLDMSWVPYAVFSIADLTVIMIFFMHFWTFANDVFDPREGKRLFPLVGSAGLIGSISGGLIVKPVVDIVGTVNLLVIWAVILIAAIPLVIWLHRSTQKSRVSFTQKPKVVREATGIRQRISSIWQVPLLRTLTYLSIPMWLVINIVDYQYLLAMNEVFDEQDQLTGFLGIFGSITALSSLVIQLFITGRFLKRFGIGTAVLAHPISLTCGTVLLAIRSLLPVPAVPQFWSFRVLSGAFAKFSDSVLDRSVAESSNQLLYNALPEDQRGQGRAFISGTVKPIATVMAGGVLILFGTLDLPFYLLTFIAVGFGLIWVALAARIKTNYLRALVASLSSRDLDLSSAAMSTLSETKDADTLPVLLEAVGSSDEQVALFALELLQDFEDPAIHDRLCMLLPAVHPRVQIAILDLLTKRGAQKIVPAIKPLLQSPDPAVCSAAIRAYGRPDSPEDLEQLKVFLDSREDLEIQTQAIIVLMRHRRPLELHLHATDLFQHMLTDESVIVRTQAAYIIGEVGDAGLLNHLLILAKCGEEQIQQAVIQAMVKLKDPETLPALIRFLSMEHLSAQTINAIVALGEPALNPLHRALQNDVIQSNSPEGSSNQEFTLKTRIIDCLGRLQRPASIPVLAGQLDAHIEVRVSALDALVRIKSSIDSGPMQNHNMASYFAPDIQRKITQILEHHVQIIEGKHLLIQALEGANKEKATLLPIDALQRAIQKHKNLALQCLQLLSDPSAIRAAASNLRRPDNRSKAEAIEVLSEIGLQGQQLARALETVYFPDSQDPSPTLSANLMRDSLVKGESTWSRACSIYAIGELHIDKLKPDLQSLLLHKQYFVRINAYLALQKLGTLPETDITKAEVQQMAHTMERILFLKSVPLFADMDGADLQWIVDIAREETYPPEATIFRENDPGDAFYIIEKGRVRIIKGDENPVVLAIRQEREYIGEMAILDDEPRLATAETQDEVKLLVISREDFQQLVLARPHIAFPLFKVLSKRLREASDSVISKQA